MTSISQRIEELRCKKGLSRPALALELGLPKISIEKFETGRLTPNQEQQKLLARFFGVSIEYLRGESTDPATGDNWLTGEVPDEEPAAPVQVPKRKIVANSEGAAGDSAGFNAIMKTEAFRSLVRETVLEVLRSPEGQKLIVSAVKAANKK